MRFANLLPFAVAALAAACAGGPQSRSPGSLSADDLMAAGDFDGAAREYSHDESGSAAVREKLANARHAAAVAHATRALAAVESGELGRAQVEAVRAESYGPDIPIVREARSAVAARAAEVQRTAEAEQHARSLLASDPAEAARILGEPGTSAEGSALRRDATLLAEANQSVARARQAWAAHDRDRTARELSSAEFAGRAVPEAEALRREIEAELTGPAPHDEKQLRDDLEFANDARLHVSVVQVLRARLVERLLASARDLEATHRPATAALLELEAKRLDAKSKTPVLDSLRAHATLTVLVRPFETAAGVKADGAAIAKAVRERLVLDTFGGGVKLVAADDSDEARSERPDALVVTGRVLSARASRGRVGRETRVVTYPTGATRKSPNSQRGKLAASIGEAVAAARVADEEQKAAAVALESERKRPFTRVAGPALSDAEQAKLLAQAQKAFDDADRELARAKAAETKAREELAAAPAEVDEAVTDEHALVITNLVKTAQLTVHLELVARGEVLLSQDVTAAATHDETVSPGFAPAGIPADPDETPDDATMSARATDRFAALAAGRIRAAAGKASGHLLVEGREAAAAGRGDEAAERFAGYLLATPDLVSPERAEAARRIEELAGVHVALRTGAKKESQ